MKENPSHICYYTPFELPTTENIKIQASVRSFQKIDTETKARNPYLLETSTCERKR